MKRQYLIFILLVLIFLGCKKGNLDDCFSNAGETITEQRQLPYFEEIHVNDNVNLIIYQGESIDVKIQAGKNLINSITTEVTDSTLVISNTMKCNWVRDFNNELNVYISSAFLKSIRYESSGDINTEGNVKFDEFEINVWGGSGTFNLDLDCKSLNLKQHYGTVDFHVKGKSGITSIFSNSYGPFYCDELDSDIVFIRNSGTNNCYVHVNHVLGADISSVGNIYYSGSPYMVSSSITGTGKLIKTGE